MIRKLIWTAMLMLVTSLAPADEITQGEAKMMWELVCTLTPGSQCDQYPFPPIVEKSREELIQLLGRPVPDDIALRGVAYQGKIYLWDDQNFEDKYLTLGHEMVHYIQEKRDVRRGFVGATMEEAQNLGHCEIEREAFFISDQIVVALNLGEHKLAGLDWYKHYPGCDKWYAK